MQCWCVPGSGCCYRLVTMLGAWFDTVFLSGCCFRLVIMLGAWFYTVLVCTMLWLLSPSDNDRSMVYKVLVYNMFLLLLSPSNNARIIVLYNIVMFYAFWLWPSASDNALSIV